MKKYWFIPIVFIGLFLTIWSFGDNVLRKPLNLKISSPDSMLQNMDLAGGPERKVRGFPKREIVDLISMYPELFIASGEKEKKLVALTFDDGPDDVFTPQFLDVLKEKDVQATFFVIGKRAEGYSKVLERIIDEGHLLGNHTWSHPDLLKLSLDEVKEEILKTEELLQSYYKDESNNDIKIFRSPYGSIDPERLEMIGEMGYKVIAWNVDSLDWKGLSAAEVKTNILENVTNGSIILQHSAGGVGEDLSGSVEALPEIIDVLKEDGFRFVTIDKFIEEIPQKSQGEEDEL